ncbi:MAG: hypothetical protein CVV27_07235 [Candidatus Melainabacteria bacterium HGW-Melainabacteria-1]|nr:MAG: hypothetical protein CVV27_07235 [Candidatus Melainabacteria bacterium HGW-Melainabacteria-1]
MQLAHSLLRRLGWLPLLLSMFSACQGPHAQVGTLVNGQRLNFAAKVNGSEDALASPARTGWQPWALEPGPDGSLYVADTQHHRILQISATGVIELLAGTDEAGLHDGPAGQARFRLPHGLSLSPGGLLIADAGNGAIRRWQAGQVTRVPVSLPLTRPVAVAAADGAIYIADAGSGRILRQPDTGPAEVLIQLSPFKMLFDLRLKQDKLIYADSDGLWQLKGAKRERLLAAGQDFSRLSGLAFWAQGLMLSDIYRHRLLGFNWGEAVQEQKLTLSEGERALRFPAALAVADDDTAYLAEPEANRIRLLRRKNGVWQSSSFARSGTQGFGVHRDGEDLALPHALRYDPHRGLLIVADYYNQRLLQLNTQGEATPWLEKSGINLPAGLALDPAGNLYVAAQHKIHKVTPTGQISVFAGDGTAGLRDGPVASSRFWLPRGMAVGPDGSLYVADHGNHAIRRIDTSGRVSTLAGNGEPGFGNGQGAAARFHHPADLIWLPEGRLLVADSWNHQLRLVDTDGRVSAFAGSLEPGLREGLRSKARFYLPSGLTRSAEGLIFVADSWNHRVRQILPSGEVQTLAGKGRLLNWDGGSVDGDGDIAQFNQPTGLSLDPQGRLLVADTANHRIRAISRRVPK